MQKCQHLNVMPDNPKKSMKNPILATSQVYKKNKFYSKMSAKITRRYI